jgi:hypothetical protein
MDHKVVGKILSCTKWSQTACSEEREEEEKLLVPVSKQNKNEFNEPTTTHTNSRGEEMCALGVDRLVIEHLKRSGQAGSKGRALCFWCLNKT